MNLYDALPHEDIKLLNDYINVYGGNHSDRGCNMPPSSMPYFLRYWSAEKEHLYHAFGDQFILKRPISFSKSDIELKNEIDRLVIWGAVPVQRFRFSFYDKIDSFSELHFDYRYTLRNFVDNASWLADNVYTGRSFTIPAQYTVNQRPLQINSGCKISKMLGKICQAIGHTNTTYQCPDCDRYWEHNAHSCHCGCSGSKFVAIDGYEAFRQAHSLALNQKTVKGNLCLSIHPLDYLTMSDNECGWSSCMQWMDECGDYRLGTIEMMNSPYIVVAYVEAMNPMYLFPSQTWSNKRWRQLLVITPELILGNKQYPYENDTVQGVALQWMRELAQKIPDHGPYSDTAVNIINSSNNIIGNRVVFVNLYFNYMYNDIYDNRLAFIKNNLTSDRISYNLSGYAVCTNCGEIIDDCDRNEPSWTVCGDCCGAWRCVHCGEWHYGDAYYADDSDDPYCWDCYDYYTSECEACGARVHNTHGLYIQMIDDPPFLMVESANWGYAVYVCDDCLRNPDELNKLFGPITPKEDMWGITRSTVSLDNITDEGMRRGGLDHQVRAQMLQVRDAKTREERLDLIDKYFL